MGEPRVLSQHRAVLPLATPTVLEDLLRVRTGTVSGDDVPLVLGAGSGRAIQVEGGPRAYSVTVDGVPMSIDVSPDDGWVQARGQWWWCGRFQAEEHSTGTLITQRTYNVASGPASLLVPYTVGRGHAERGRRALRTLVDELGRRHGCEGSLLD